ncbi:hypothetical protein B0H67DRAFT_575922 [Lasiosphaeris hirsuta]|uniref:Uncharacterized protein n=1 Tax=Lasiosphaeris hirsuta TaxID=260670 RepID=A0AA40AR28_9PEZI|nr:hypothetical protein B0H67DRAFT_575922 [Lasiosphaeris hirsuta]
MIPYRRRKNALPSKNQVEPMKGHRDTRQESKTREGAAVMAFYPAARALCGAISLFYPTRVQSRDSVIRWAAIQRSDDLSLSQESVSFYPRLISFPLASFCIAGLLLMFWRLQNIRFP